MKLKFLTDEDKKSFLMEIGLVSEISKVTPEWTPTDEMVQSFIKKRKEDRELTYKLKDFRRSQNTKQQWRHDRYKIMKGIKRFHRSTAGKQFHRQLGRFIATREDFGATEITEVVDLLKAISSAKTHLFIEMDYYMSMDEYIDYLVILDEALPLFNLLESKVLDFSFEIDEDSFELLCRLVHRNDIVVSLGDEGKVNKAWQEVSCCMDEAGELEDSPLFYTHLINAVKARLEKV